MCIAYRKLLEDAKNRKRRKDKEWSHKSLCLYHDIYPVAQPYFDEIAIPESQWKICQCGEFETVIKQCTWKYRAGLNEVIKTGVGTRKGAYYTDLSININGQFYKVQLLSMQAGEIKKSTQPATRKKRLGTGTFYQDTFIQKLGEKGGKKGVNAGPYYIQWRLKNRYSRQKIPIKKGETSKDVADWWYQNWSVHGLREEKKVNLDTKQFVAIHNNIFIGGTSREACEERIVLYIFAGTNAPDIKTMEINGIKLKTKQECEQIEENVKELREEKKELREEILVWKHHYEQERKKNIILKQQYQEEKNNNTKLTQQITNLQQKIHKFEIVNGKLKIENIKQVSENNNVLPTIENNSLNNNITMICMNLNNYSSSIQLTQHLPKLDRDDEPPRKKQKNNTYLFD